MIVLLFGHAEPQRYDVQKPWRFRRGSGAVKVIARVENKFINADFEGVAWQNLRVGAPVAIGGKRFQECPVVAINPKQLYF